MIALQFQREYAEGGSPATNLRRCTSRRFHAAGNTPRSCVAKIRLRLGKQLRNKKMKPLTINLAIHIMPIELPTT